MENFIKLASCTPFQGTLPRELVEKLGRSATEVSTVALSFPAPGQSLVGTTSRSPGPWCEQKAVGPAWGWGVRALAQGRPHAANPLKSIEMEDSVPWAQSPLL